MADKMVTCKSCGQQIAKSAKSCPNCGAKNKGSKLPIVIGVVVVIIVIGAIGASGGGSQPQKVSGSSSASAATNSTSASTSAKTKFGIGDTADFDGVQIKLSSAVLSRGSTYVKPDAGKLYLGLIVDIANNSSKDINISSIGNFEAYCDDYSLNQSLSGQQAPEWDGISQLDGSVAAGKRMNGVIVYEVPEGFSKFELSASPSFWSSKSVTFDFTQAECDSSAL
ncbi:MAG: DUF4352 domain-containing protein [Eggerthellaceae bacterium]|nr:DUF4352 domain-containing protein [Eggerthellaceae bacterium]